MAKQKTQQVPGTSSAKKKSGKQPNQNPNKPTKGRPKKIDLGNVKKPVKSPSGNSTPNPRKRKPARVSKSVSRSPVQSNAQNRKTEKVMPKQKDRKLKNASMSEPLPRSLITERPKPDIQKQIIDKEEVMEVAESNHNSQERNTSWFQSCSIM